MAPPSRVIAVAATTAKDQAGFEVVHTVAVDRYGDVWKHTDMSGWVKLTSTTTRRTPSTFDGE